ncbi:MAG: glycosyltransferase, partial [Planctomycetes bacterium]|nr:glycosyltransferase [Planctomycetota bacterium]
MKILLLTNMFPSVHNPTYGIFIKEQVDSLKALGVEIDVLFIEGYRNKWNYIKAIFTLYHKILSTHYDLIHCHYGLSGWVGRMQCLLPMVVTFHGDDILGTPGPNGKYALTGRILAGLNKILARLSNGVIVQSDRMRHKSGCARAQTIPCGVDFDRFKIVDRTTACRQLGLDPQKKYILFPSNPAIPVKNFRLAEAAFNRVKTVIPDAELITLDKPQPRERIVLYMNACDALLF